MTTTASNISILVTGAGGNLGGKLIAGLVTRDWCTRIVALDRTIPPSATPDPKVHWLEGDLTRPAGSSLQEALAGVDAVVHFAARNPYPDAPWTDACASFDMTLAMLAAAAQTNVRRVVFASSNHVMGQYKDAPLADTLAPGSLTTCLPPGPGTRWFNGREVVQGFAYAASKLMGERACIAEARRSSGTLTSVSIRIGWCQPGENKPQTLNTSGLPGEQDAGGSDAERDLRWFRNMWLSNRDFVAVIEGALLANEAQWPGPGIVVNGMSANCGMPWDVECTRQLIGYEPQDDVWEHLG